MKVSTRSIALAMVVFNAFCVVHGCYLKQWDRVLVDFTDVLQWFLVYTLAKEIDELTANGKGEA